MITTKLIFDRKKQAKKDGTGTIEVRVISDRRAYYISTGVRIREREWRAGMIINRPDAQSLNERIAIICQIIDTEVNRCIEANLTINTENLKNKVWAVKDTMSNEPSFLDWLDHQTEILNLSAGTIKHYVTLHTRLTEYGKIKRWGDLTTENISEFDAWLHKRKLSTGVAYVSSLLPPAVAVLEKYGWQVPKIDNADYNHLLKVIGTMADIPTKMHTHLARHTFATYMLRQGVKVENLQRMLGHKNIRQTMRYAKVLAESVHEDFDMVAAKMAKKTKKKK